MLSVSGKSLLTFEVTPQHLTVFVQETPSVKRPPVTFVADTVVVETVESVEIVDTIRNSVVEGVVAVVAMMVLEN